MKPLSWFWCYIFVTHKLHFFFFLSPVLCNCLLCVPFCRGVGRREGEPDRDRANRKTETPASPQRALPLPAVRESTRDTHQVLYKDTHTHTIECRQCPWTVTYPAMKRQMLTSWVLHGACFFLLCLLGGSAVSHYWMRPKQFFHTLTKRWVREESNLGMSSFTAVCLQQTLLAGQVRLFQMADDKNWERLLSLLISQLVIFFLIYLLVRTF